MRPLICNLIFALALISSFMPVIGSGIVAYGLIDTFQTISETAEMEHDLSEGTRLAILGAILVIGGYIMAALLLVPLLFLKELRKARIVRNILIGVSVLLVLQFPVGTGMVFFTFCMFYITRDKFNA